MTQSVESNNQETSRAWQWLLNGWHALRDRAASAVTYFTPQREQEKTSLRWGVLATDITEQKKAVVVELELPGIDRDSLSVQVHNDHLIVSGERHTSSSRHEGSLVVTERAFGSFQRAMPLPCEVTSQGTKAVFKNGVLSVTMPKDTSLQPRSIPIARG
jgi:HSP20 family protein